MWYIGHGYTTTSLNWEFGDLDSREGSIIRRFNVTLSEETFILAAIGY